MKKLRKSFYKHVKESEIFSLFFLLSVKVLAGNFLGGFFTTFIADLKIFFFYIPTEFF
jgi:hypothetical protein